MEQEGGSNYSRDLATKPGSKSAISWPRTEKSDICFDSGLLGTRISSLGKDLAKGGKVLFSEKERFQEIGGGEGGVGSREGFSLFLCCRTSFPISGSADRSFSSRLVAPKVPDQVGAIDSSRPHASPRPKRDEGRFSS